jgi:hypothetical protein
VGKIQFSSVGRFAIPPQRGSYSHAVIGGFIEAGNCIDRGRAFIKAKDDINAYTQLTYSLGYSVNVFNEVSKRNSAEVKELKEQSEVYKTVSTKRLREYTPVILNLEAKIIHILHKIFSRDDLNRCTERNPTNTKIRDQVNFALDELVKPAIPNIQMYKEFSGRTVAGLKAKFFATSLLKANVNDLNHASIRKSSLVKLTKNLGSTKTAFAINTTFVEDDIKFPTERYSASSGFRFRCYSIL